MSKMKFLADAENAVEDALRGFKCTYPALFVDPRNRIVLRNQIAPHKVCLVSGGGSGHEPFSVGFVGEGMLSGAVAGLIFASPPPQKIFQCIHTLSSRNKNAGVLVIVLNYTGDILNFGSAVEEAKSYNINVEMVIVDEDCSRIGDEVQGAGRRGMCGSGFVYKIAGSMAQNSMNLYTIANQCRLINSSMASIGAAVTPCTMPGFGPLFNIDEDEIEVGLGVHGEAGISKTKVNSIDVLIQSMVEKIIQNLGLLPSNKVAVIINNLGTVSQLEVGVICNKVYNQLTDANVVVCRMYFGSLMTSLDMAGFQISVLNVTNNLYWVDYLDNSTDAPGWPATCVSVPLPESKEKITIENVESSLLKAHHGQPRTPKSSLPSIGPKLSSEGAMLFEKCLHSILDILIAKENRDDELESISRSSDDPGSALERVAERILQDMPTLDMQHPAACFYHVSEICYKVGGSSGVLYGILFTSCTKFLTRASTIDWLKMWKTCLDTLLSYCNVKIGDKTVVNVLLSAFEEFETNFDTKEVLLAFEDAVKVGKLKCSEICAAGPKFARSKFPSPDFTLGSYADVYWVSALLEMISQTLNKYYRKLESY